MRETGSENAPEDSAFISEDGDEKIVNESSLYGNEEENIGLLTGRSESAIEEDDCYYDGISKCKAINSSFINLKNNNLLIAFGRK